MSTEWSISLDYRMTSVSSYWRSIIHFTIGAARGRLGDRTPALFMNPGAQGFQFTTTLNDNDFYEYNNFEYVQVNRVYKIEIHQRYISNGNYRYFIKIDGDEVHSAINSKARQFYNVKVYAGNPWDDASIGFISKLQFTNFL